MYFLQIDDIYINPKHVTTVEKSSEEGETIIDLTAGRVRYVPTGDAEDVADRLACAEEGKTPEEADTLR